MKGKFLSIGGATEDFTFYTHEGVLIKNNKGKKGSKLWAFEYASKMKVDQAFSSFGGGASNAAVNFAGLGFESAIIVAVGDDNRGEDIKKNFVSKGVNIEYLQVANNLPSSSSFIAVGKDKEYIAFVSRAAANKLKLTKKDENFAKNFDWVYLASLSGEWEKNLAVIFGNNSYRVYWNPGKAQIEAGVDNLFSYLKKTSVLSLNLDEAIRLLAYSKDKKLKEMSRRQDKKEILKFFRSLVLEVAVLTNGRNGSYAYDGHYFYHQKALMCDNKVDTTGVGDAFGSSFLAGLQIDGDIAKSMKFGAMSACSVLGKMGAQNGLLSNKDVKKFFK